MDISSVAILILCRAAIYKTVRIIRELSGRRIGSDLVLEIILVAMRYDAALQLHFRRSPSYFTLEKWCEETMLAEHGRLEVLKL